MRVPLKTGRQTAELPDVFFHSSIILRPSLPDVRFSDGEIRDMLTDSLESPADGGSLADGMKPGGACIVVSDKTRGYGLDIWLPRLLDCCNRCGTPDREIIILFATGAHAAQTPAERAALAGREAAGRVRLADHDCDAADSLATLGKTSAGTPVLVNRAAAEAANLLLTGTVMPHYYAGFTGGRKSVLPGVCARETIFANHGLNLAAGGGTHPLARTMNLRGNPVHEDMVEALRFVNVTYSINVVAGEGGRPAAFFSGDVIGAHERACAAAKEWMGTKIEERREWAVASCGGFPKDISFYQAHKALDNAFRAVRPGGTLVLLAECAEGIGPEGFGGWFETGGPAEIESLLRKKYVVMGHTALRTLEKTRAVKVVLVSKLPRGFVESIGAVPAENLSDALKYIDAEREPGYIIPEAAMTVPVLAGGEC